MWRFFECMSFFHQDCLSTEICLQSRRVWEVIQTSSQWACIPNQYNKKWIARLGKVA